VIHHDFPEFLSDNHFSLCNSIPTHCTQLRNLIVSAYPSGFMDLPDPFTAGLKVDRIEEMRKAPTIRADLEQYLRAAGISDLVDAAIGGAELSEDDAEKIIEAIDRSGTSSDEFTPDSNDINIPLLNALVIYLASRTLHLQGSKTSIFNPSAPSTALLEAIVHGLRPEARYHIISAMANQLRWPNSQTHYFTYAMLHLFGQPSHDQNQLEVQQTITRVLLERLLVNRPHPWGLIITLLEIMKNSQYRFWDLPFVKAAPEVRYLLPERSFWQGALQDFF
jgi:CCR4-NOT transcription complex subunit 1